MGLRYTLETRSAESGDGSDVNSDETDGWTGAGKEDPNQELVATLPREVRVEMVTSGNL